jgi:hypothetical protein
MYFSLNLRTTSPPQEQISYNYCMNNVSLRIFLYIIARLFNSLDRLKNMLVREYVLYV